MAHFVKINEDNTTGDIIVVANEAILDDNGEESELLGLEFIASLGLDGRWVQCSYNGSMRGSYPGRGFTYSETLDVFLPVKPDGDYVWDEEAGDWVANDTV